MFRFPDTGVNPFALPSDHSVTYSPGSSRQEGVAQGLRVRLVQELGFRIIRICKSEVLPLQHTER